MSTLRTALMTAATLGLSVPASAQDHSMDNMPGMEMPAPKKAVPKKAKTSPAKPKRATPASVKKPSSPAALPAAPEVDHSKMNHGPTSDAVMDHGMDQQWAKCRCQLRKAKRAQKAWPCRALHCLLECAATPFPNGSLCRPSLPSDEMARAHAEMMKESGGLNFGAALLNIAEYQAHRGNDGYRWMVRPGTAATSIGCGSRAKVKASFAVVWTVAMCNFCTAMPSTPTSICRPVYGRI
jgi:copper resistance protein B